MLFDGEEFNWVQGEPVMITDLLTTSNGITYYAGNNTFGNIIKDDNGVPHYYNLTDQIKEEHRQFGTVWNLLEFENQILIPTRENLFRFSGEHFERTKPKENTFYRAYTVNDTHYLSEIDVGLYRLTDTGELNFIEGSDQLTENLTPYYILPYDDYRVLVGTVQDGLFLFYTEPFDDKQKGTLEPFQNQVNEELKASNSTQGILLSNGNYALSTQTAGVFIINRNGELVQAINSDSGLQSEVINNIFEDRQGNLWLALNYGFAIAEISNPLSRYGEDHGLEGSIIDVHALDETLFAATSLGLFQKNGRRFEANPDISSFTWDLNTFSSPTNTNDVSLLAANDFGLYKVTANETLRLSSHHTMSLLQSSANPQRIYGGTPLGLYYIDVDIDGEVIEESDNLLQFDNPVRQLLEDEDGGVWMATQSDGLRYLSGSFDIENVTTYREDEEYDVTSNATMRYINGELFVSTVDNFYRYDPVTDGFVEWSFPGISNDELTGIYRFYNRDDIFWAGASSQRNNITEFRDIYSESADKISNLFTPVPSTVTLVIKELMGDIWFGNARGLYQYSELENVETADFSEVQIRNIDIISDTTLSISPQAPGKLTRPYSNDRFRFTVAAPWFDADLYMDYRFKLEGYDDQWSDWTNNHTVEYTSLREGDYNFTVQARNRDGLSSDIATYSFTIQPAWFRSGWAFILLGVLIVGIIFTSARFINRYQTRKLEEFNQKLEAEVNERSKEVRRQNEQLKQLNLEKDEFMEIAVHDLRNPLSGIQGIAGLMSDKSTDLNRDEVKEFGDAIRKSTVRMFELIYNYLNVHRIEQGLVKAERDQVSLDSLVQSSLKRFKAQAEKKNMKLNYIPATDNEIFVIADSSLFSQILDNLLSNAIKYSPLGSTITIKTGMQKNKGLVAVTDQGPGISEEKQSQLYRKFSRVGNTPTGGEVSTGLGLSIVKQLVEMMDGSIECDSSPGKGTTFTVYMPLV